MKILVTGGAGFVGANLVRLLLQEGHQVTVLDNLSAGRLEYIADLPLTFVRGDILDVPLMNQVVRDHDGIVHLAAQTGVPGSLADPRRDCEVNVIGTLNMLEAAAGVGLYGPMHLLQKRHGWNMKDCELWARRWGAGNLKRSPFIRKEAAYADSFGTAA